MRLQGEQQRAHVQEHEDAGHGGTHDLAFEEALAARREHEEGRHEKAGHREEERRGVNAGGLGVELLLAVPEPPEEECETEDEEQVSEDRSGERGLHDLDLALQQQENRDDQLGDVAEGRVQQPPDPWPRVKGELLGGAADQSREGEHGSGRDEEDEQLGVEDELAEDRDRHEHEQPVERWARQLPPLRRRRYSIGHGRSLPKSGPRFASLRVSG